MKLKLIFITIIISNLCWAESSNPCGKEDPCFQISPEEFIKFDWESSSIVETFQKNIHFTGTLPINSRASGSTYTYKMTEKSLTLDVSVKEIFSIQHEDGAPILHSQIIFSLIKTPIIEYNVWPKKEMPYADLVPDRHDKTIHNSNAYTKELKGRGDVIGKLSHKQNIKDQKNLILYVRDIGPYSREIKIPPFNLEFPVISYSGQNVKRNRYGGYPIVTIDINHEKDNFVIFVKLREIFSQHFKEKKAEKYEISYWINFNKNKLYLVVNGKVLTTFKRKTGKPAKTPEAHIKSIKQNLEGSISQLQILKKKMLDDVFFKTYGAILFYLNKALTTLNLKLSMVPGKNPNNLLVPLKYDVDVAQDFEIAYFILNKVVNNQVQKDSIVKLYLDIVKSFLKKIEAINSFYQLDLNDQGSRVLSYMAESLEVLLNQIWNGADFQKLKESGEHPMEYFKPLLNFMQQCHGISINQGLGSESHQVIKESQDLVRYCQKDKKSIFAPLKKLENEQAIQEVQNLVEIMSDLLELNDTPVVEKSPEQVWAESFGDI